MSPTSHTVAEIIGVIVTIASALANVIPAKTLVGKIVHFLAGNWNANTMPQAPAPEAGGTP